MFQIFFLFSFCLCFQEKFLLIKIKDTLYAIKLHKLEQNNKETFFTIFGNNPRTEKIKTENFIPKRIGELNCLNQKSMNSFCKGKEVPVFTEKIENEKEFSWFDSSGLFTINRDPLFVSGVFKKKDKTYRFYKEKEIYRIKEIVEGSRCGNII